MKSRFFALLTACLLLLPLVACVRRDRLPDRQTVYSAESDLGTDSDGAPVFLRCRNSARSSESRYLVLLLDWELISTDGKSADVTVTVSLSHYGIQVGARDGGRVTVGDASQTFSTPALRAGGTLQTVTPLATRTFSVSLDSLAAEPIPISAAWNFDGTYHGQSLGTLRAADTVRLG